LKCKRNLAKKRQLSSVEVGNYYILLGSSFTIESISVATRKYEKAHKTIITLSAEVKEELKKRAKQTFGTRQGYLSMYCEMTFRNHFGMNQPRVEEP